MEEHQAHPAIGKSEDVSPPIGSATKTLSSHGRITLDD